jgi:hypothetical protein
LWRWASTTLEEEKKMVQNDPFARLPEVASFSVTSSSVSDGEALGIEQMSGLSGIPGG